MSNKKDQKEVATKSQKMQNGLSNFIIGNRKLLIIVGCAILVILIALGVVLYMNDRNLEKRFAEIDALQTSYVALMSEDTSSADYQGKVDSLIAELEALSQVGGKKYPGARAEYTLGLLYWDQADYQQAMDAFIETHSRMPKTYLGSLSLFNAGASAEQLGDDAKAMEYYQQLRDEYGSNAAESPKALFGLARLNEKAGNTELAKAFFQQLADEFPASEYAKLAQNRLILL